MLDRLLFEVARKFPDETRFDTALRYIRQAEEREGSVAQEQTLLHAAAIFDSAIHPLTTPCQNCMAAEGGPITNNCPYEDKEFEELKPLLDCNCCPSCIRICELTNAEERSVSVAQENQK